MLRRSRRTSWPPRKMAHGGARAPAVPGPDIVVRHMTLGRLVLMGIAGVAAVAQPATDLSADDRAAIQELMTKYAQALSGCKAAEFADLFVSGAGAFASGF